MGGTAGWLPSFPCPRILPVVLDDRVDGLYSSVVCLLKVSCLRFGRGGGNGDIDIEVTLAECA